MRLFKVMTVSTSGPVKKKKETEEREVCYERSKTH